MTNDPDRLSEITISDAATEGDVAGPITFDYQTFVHLQIRKVPRRARM